MEIRKSHPDDAEALAECIDAAYAAYKLRIDDLPAVSAGIADDIANNLVFVATKEWMVVGGIIVINNGDFAQVANVAVDPHSSGLGLGRALMERAEQECRNLGIRELRLNTHVEIPENIHLYKHLGWQSEGVVGRKVHMSKQI
ncbi:MAG: GNAT family N-acetyltransferase [Rhizobiaceae bacterium]